MSPQIRDWTAQGGFESLIKSAYSRMEADAGVLIEIGGQEYGST